MPADPQPGETWIITIPLTNGVGTQSRGRLVENVLSDGTIAWRHVGRPTVYSSPARDWHKWVVKTRAKLRVEVA